MRRVAARRFREIVFVLVVEVVVQNVTARRRARCRTRRRRATAATFGATTLGTTTFRSSFRRFRSPAFGTRAVRAATLALPLSVTFGSPTLLLLRRTLRASLSATLLAAALFRSPLLGSTATLRLRRRGVIVIVDDVVIEIVEPIRNRRFAPDMFIAGRFIFVATGGTIT